MPIPHTLEKRQREEARYQRMIGKRQQQDKMESWLAKQYFDQKQDKQCTTIECELERTQPCQQIKGIYHQEIMARKTKEDKTTIHYGFLTQGNSCFVFYL